MNNTPAKGEEEIRAALFSARPKYRALDHLEEGLQEITQLKQRMADLQQDIQQRAVALAGIVDKNDRLRAVRYLYWTDKRVNTAALAAALLIEWDTVNDRPKHGPVNLAAFEKFTHDMRRMVGPFGWVRCRTGDCDGLAPIESRTALEQFRNGQFHAYCENCASCPMRPVPCKDWRSACAERAARWEQERIEREQHQRAEMAELVDLKVNSALTGRELVRLYELMSRYEERE
jgi:hypothetical protein